MMRTLRISTLLITSVLAATCSTPAPVDVKTPPPPDTTYATPEQHATVDKAVVANDGGGLRFSAELLDLCPGVRPPKFGFDSAVLREEWLVALQTVAECMMTGGLRDKALILTGHCDPRGDDAYNMALGARRAEAVKAAIVSFGIYESRLSTSSRGKADAKGTDEESWALDRYVDVGLR